MIKSYFLSKTVWAGILIALLGLFEVFKNGNVAHGLTLLALAFAVVGIRTETSTTLALTPTLVGAILLISVGVYQIFWQSDWSGGMTTIIAALALIGVRLTDSKIDKLG